MKIERGKICVSVAAVDAAAVFKEVQSILELVDVVEVRLDAMGQPEVAKCCALLRKPLLLTNRPNWEGGAYQGSEDERLIPLLAGVELGAAYVDLELRAAEHLRTRLLSSLTGGSTRMILSWHDFSSTPSSSELENILEQMMASGAHIGKIVTTAHTVADVLRVLGLQEKAAAEGFALSSFCMGGPGRISRLATLYLGGYMSYGALDDERATAPGQLSVDTLYALCSRFEGER